MERMNIMFAGFGRTAQVHHIPAIECNPRIKIAAVYDIDENVRSAAAEKYGCNVYASCGEALAAPGIDLVVILTRNDMHSQMACDFLNAGKNVLVTKPWALDIYEADRMLKAAQKSGKMLLPWLPCRWGSDLEALRGIIESGKIGKVFMVRRSYFTFGRRCDWQTKREFGGGYLLNWGPHLIDQAIELTGERVRSVYGVLKQVINPGDAEDMFYSVMTTEGGATLIAEFNIGADVGYDWLVQGDSGTVTVKGDRIEIHSATQPEVIDPAIYRNDVKIIATLLDDYSSEHMYGDHEEIYRHIAQTVMDGMPYRVSPESAYNLTRVLDAVRASSESGEVIKL